MKCLVINLKYRVDRLKIFQKNWDWLDYEINEGIVHNVPHSGCSLAHISAIKQGLKNNNWCLILEDDAILNCSKELFLEVIAEATKIINWDAVFLGAEPHEKFAVPSKITYLNELFFKASRTKSLRNCTAMLWSTNSLPILKEYENILLQNFIFPIDRMLTSFSYPWKKENEDNESWDEVKNYFLLTNVPNVWICKMCLIKQINNYSDNTKQLVEMKNDYNQYLTKLFMQGLQE